jgi:adenylate cyclase
MIVILAGAVSLAIWKVYLRPASVTVASVEKMAFPLPDKPSIAVLPFVNISGDPKQEYFSDGLTEEIITALGKVPQLFVIARNSTFAYKGKPVKVQQVSEELGVRYVLEGSVRKDGNNIRIAAQLIDALTGNHLWAERYDRNLKDIFTVQDEITKKIITAMQVKLTEGEQAKTHAMGTKNLEAYLKFLQARELGMRFNPESNALAKQLAEEAIALDPMYTRAYAVLGWIHQVDAWLGISKSPKDSIDKSIELYQKAITLDDTYGAAHAFLGWLFSMTGQHDKAVAEGEKAVALNPNSADSHSALGNILRFAGRYEESILEYKTAIRLNPIPPGMYLYSLGSSYALMGNLDEAITWGEKAVRRDPNSMMAHLFMAGFYSRAGRDEEARVEAAEVLRINPKFSLENFAKSVTYKKQEDVERTVSALRKAGLK